MTFSTVIVSPSRSGVRASPAARSADVNMKNSSMPMLHEEVDPQKRQRQCLDLRRGVDEIEQRRRREVTDRPSTTNIADRREKRLLDDAIDALGIAGAGKPRDQHRLAREQRRHEDDDHEEDLPADADGRVGACSPMQMTDQHVIDHALHARPPGSGAWWARRASRPPD